MFATQQKTWQRKRRIYLAGKISADDWRFGIVKGLDGAILDVEATRNDLLLPWPILPRSIFNTCDYVGPFFVSCDHGCWHGENQHGSGAENGGCFGWAGEETRRPQVVKHCLGAIDKADLVFAWLDCADAHGTLVELGYAVAQGTPIIIGVPHGLDLASLGVWFPLYLPAVEVRYADTPAEALRPELHRLGWLYDFDSPLEEEFWQACYYQSELTPQVEVLDGKYRLDFAHLPTRTAIELDGFNYHNDNCQFQRDRQRDRELTLAGWTTVRFASTELKQDIHKCVTQAYGVIKQRKGA